jgi:iron complex transport system permease protein
MSLTRSAAATTPRYGAARTALVWPGALLLLAVAVALGVALGTVNLTPAQVIDGLFDRGSTLDRTIVWDLRVPRVLLAMMVGACLGVCGALLQGVTRNPLGDPHILGLTAGAGLAASIVLKTSRDAPASALVPAAIAGAGVAAVILYGMSFRGGTSATRLALSGVAVASLFTAGITTLLVSSNLGTQAALAFLAGGLFGRGWDDVHVLWPYAAAAVLASLFLARGMNVLALGDEAAQSLGLSVERTRFIALAVATVLAGASVAVAGMIAFVGLVIPHAGRLLVGDDHRKLIPLSAILGAALIVYADLFSRIVEKPVEIPLGIVTAAIGAPVLLYLVRWKT